MDPTPPPVFIAKETMMRLLKDVREIMTAQVSGVHYTHSETDMLCGYAMIVGPEDSLYDGGYYFYRFKLYQYHGKLYAQFKNGSQYAILQ